MKGGFSTPGDYIYFKSQVPLHKIPFRFSINCSIFAQNNGDIMNPGIAGTTNVYYKQIMALSMKGYRLISINIPRVWNNQEWVQAFEKFLDISDVHHTPSFLLKRYVLTGIPNGPHEPFIVDSVDFVVTQVETLTRGDLASRLTLISDVASVGPLLLSDCLITIMDVEVKMLLISS
uniref:Uncharacterized protein n=1 Tax=Lactuca sativa TaxID=4236 RepID=A0A9R1UNI7_LACSA|nr:hypothetical protein LSAT_V11C800451210 [Lactuca sativa]